MNGFRLLTNRWMRQDQYFPAQIVSAACNTLASVWILIYEKEAKTLSLRQNVTTNWHKVQKCVRIVFQRTLNRRRVTHLRTYETHFFWKLEIEFIFEWIKTRLLQHYTEALQGVVQLLCKKIFIYCQKRCRNRRFELCSAAGSEKIFEGNC